MLKALNLNDDAAWKRRYRASSIGWATTAKNNPARGLVCTNRDGILQLYAWDVETGDLRQMTNMPAGVVSGLISSDGESIYYHQDEQGNEIGHYVRIPFVGGEPEDITPDMPPYASFSISQSHSGNVTGFLAAGQDGFKMYVQKDGATTLLHQSDRMGSGPSLSYDGEIGVVTSTERSGTLDASIIAYDVATGEQIAELWDGEDTSLAFGKFSPLAGDFRMLATTSKSGYNRPFIWNPRTGERTELKLDDIPGEVAAWDWSGDAKRVLLRQLYQAEYQLYVYNLETDAVTKLNHPTGVVGGFTGGSFTKSGEILVTWQDSANPSRLVALDGETGEQLRVVLEAEDIPAGRKWQSMTFKSENGAEIQGWLVTPEGDGPWPTILQTHGGPSAVMSEYYSPASQTWVDHGFAFLSINYHGSTTFGKDFEKSIWGNLGDLEVQDMAAAYQWLVDNNIAIPDSVLLTGGSYGGYLTLQAAGRRPDLWVGGMAVVAIADWKLMYEDQAQTLRGYQRALFGGTPEEKPAAHESASPITYAKDIKGELLVIQGSNDTRCPSRQMEVYEKKLQELGKQITVHWFDAGHGSRANEQQIEQQELMLHFAYRVLG
jgi:dipeptidyl aminopeptidase/acylaminoacyl peptidase